MRFRHILWIWAAILALTIAQSGCQKKEEQQHTEDEAQKETEAHHAHTAPHGGTLVVLGEEFAHLEFVLDAGTAKLTAYVLDGEAENPVRLAQNTIELKGHRQDTGADFTLNLNGVANVLTGETEGDTSEFVGQSEALKGAAAFQAELVSITVKGQTFTDIDFAFPEGNEDEGAHSGH